MIAIGRLFSSNLPPEWLLSYEAMVKPEFITFNTVRAPIHLARNNMARSLLAQPEECTHLFFLDDDVCLPSDGLTKLLQDSVEHDLGVVSGLYIHRGEPHLPVAFRRNAEGEYKHLAKFVDGLQEIDACGAGCLLIRRDVLEAIQATGDEWFDWSLKMSEDMAFCARAQACGFRIALDGSVKCGHIGGIGFSFEMFQERYSAGFYSEPSKATMLTEDVRPWQDAPKPAPLSFACARTSKRSTASKKRSRR